MRYNPDCRRIARIRTRRPAEVGLTLIELLLSIALLAILTSFFAGGLSIGRRAFDMDRSASVASDDRSVMQSIAGLIASMQPVSLDAAKTTQSAFKGGQRSVSFVNSSDGRTLRGGLHRMTLGIVGSNLVLDVLPARVSGNRLNTGAALPPIVLLSNVKSLQLAYFGARNDQGPAWSNDWTDNERLPRLISMQVEFKDGKRNDAPLVIAVATDISAPTEKTSAQAELTKKDRLEARSR